MTRVKVCGLTTERDHAAAVAAGADAVGIIADVPVETPREVSVETATALRAATPPFVTSVLVTMPATPSTRSTSCGRSRPTPSSCTAICQSATRRTSPRTRRAR